ncbi:uncharacterized protein LOC128503945 [Spea bombifrons]|uniref:uncharacterized protein LOC128503945 n=1 Tax=Spea bombifrons TaxID=233779 RepID=UPI002349B74E|nr:uncharacterized protein LOC128503945 [Spea bombifrons]
METVDGAEGSLPAQGDPGTEGAADQWGEFQGTCCRGGDSGKLQGWGGQDSWDAFSDADPEETDPRRTETSNGQWWCEESTMLCAGPAPRPIDRAGLERLLENCFPSNPVPRVEDDIEPLEQSLAAHGQTPSPARTRTVGCLLGTPRDRRTNPDLQRKWEGSALHKSYLSSLHIDPDDKVHPHRAKFPSGSPAPREKQPPHKVPGAGGKETELKLMKVASVSVHVSGFGPSHHLQSLFHHWTQPQGKTRLKLAYDFNRSLLV